MTSPQSKVIQEKPLGGWLDPPLVSEGLTPVRIKPDSFQVDSLATSLSDDDMERNVLLVESVLEGTKAFAAR